jgi:YD repeat-containing protein
MKKSDGEKYDLKGAVKSVRISSFKAVGNLDDIKQGIQLNSFPHSNNLTLFNESGKITEEIYFNLDDSLRFKYVLTYDENERLIRNESFHDDYSERTRTNYKYDEQGKLIEEVHYARILKKTTGLILNHKKTFSYDENGNLIEENFSNGNPYFDQKKTYKFDDNANLTNQLDLDADGQLKDKSMYKYDEHGNKTEFTYRDVGGAITTFLYKYDANGNLIEEGTKGSSIKTSYEYDYDNQGNWIKKIQFSSKNAECIVIRVIEYWK